MIDINLIREKPEWVKEQIAKKFDYGAIARIDVIAELDIRHRALRTKYEQLRAEINTNNKMIGAARTGRIVSSPEEIEALQNKSIELQNEAEGMRSEIGNLENAIEHHMLWIPNLPHASVPIGRGKDQ